MFYIYTLCDPRDMLVRYVGWSGDPFKRLRWHIYNSRRHSYHNANWVRSLLDDGVEPFMVLVDAFSSVEEARDVAEPRWISHYRKCGCDLTNATDGGEGVKGGKSTRRSFSEEHKAKISRYWTGRKRSDATKAKISQALTGRRLSEETKERLRRTIRAKAEALLMSKQTGKGEHQMANDTPNMSGADFRKLRDEKRLSRKALAELSGVSAGTIVNIEAERNEPRPATREAVLKALQAAE